MRSQITRALTFAMYQLTLFAGILLLPVALAIGQLGITLPIHRLVDTFGDAYQRRTPNSSR